MKKAILLSVLCFSFGINAAQSALPMAPAGVLPQDILEQAAPQAVWFNPPPLPPTIGEQIFDVVAPIVAAAAQPPIAISSLILIGAGVGHLYDRRLPFAALTLLPGVFLGVTYRELGAFREIVARGMPDGRLKSFSTELQSLIFGISSMTTVGLLLNAAKGIK